EFRASGNVDAPRPDGWWGARLDDRETLAVIAEHHDRSGVLLDPHTAVGVGAVDRITDLPDVPIVCLATAHPAKFPDAVEKATGVRPPLPTHLADLLDRLRQSQAGEEDLARVEQRVATVSDSARCYLAIQHEQVVGSILELFPDEVRAHATAELGQAPVELIAPILDIRDGRALLDERHLGKQPDWTYDEVYSGQAPADRVDQRSPDSA
ncbi:MAG: hypothetical protein KY452_03180, partial [Actinobacteria bacterium]|nr:hypothetical protein [Actinomycetota bacterium]